MNKYYLTKEKLEELKKELEYLKTQGRAEVAENLRKAKEYGDLSENAEYSQAKEDQQRLESRIVEIENILRNVVIIKSKSRSNKIEIGSTVHLKKDNEIYKYTIVGKDEIDISQGKISNESPLGRTLLGKKVGDRVEVVTPTGKIIYQIIKIE